MVHLNDGTRAAAGIISTHAALSSAPTTPAPTTSPAPNPLPTPPPTDRQALEALYEDTGGASAWIDKSGWMSGDPCDGWSGIECDQEGAAVVTLVVDENVQGSLPSELGLLGGLQALSVVDSPSLAGSIPSQLGALSSLKLAQFLGVPLLSGPIPSQVGLLQSRKCLLGTMPEPFHEVSSLSFTPTCAPVSLILPLVEHMYFADTKLTGSIPSDIGSMSSRAWTEYALIKPASTSLSLCASLCLPCRAWTL